MSWIYVLKLPNIVCKEIVEKRSLFTKGKGSQRSTRTGLGPGGFSSGGI